VAGGVFGDLLKTAVMTTAHFLTTAWQGNPWVIAASAATLIIYGVSQWGRLQLRAGWLLAGVLLFYLTLASPIDTLADGYLFSAHMLQHLLLLLLVPALILLGLPAVDGPDPGLRKVLMRLGMSALVNSTTGRLVQKRRQVAALPNGLRPENRPAASFRPGTNGMPGRALAGWLLGVGGMWFWHAPALCDAAVTNLWVHRLQYVSLLGMGFAFWWPIIGPRLGQRLSALAGMVYLFTACLGCTILGIIITLAPVEVCSIYLHPVDRLGILPLLQSQWGLTPAYDQQLGGLLMWVPACLIYFTGILGLFARWHREGGAPEHLARATLTNAPMKKTHAG
jgi:cytochrome c oxidase assembly factor CtaG